MVIGLCPFWEMRGKYGPFACLVRAFKDLQTGGVILNPLLSFENLFPTDDLRKIPLI